MGVFSNNRRGGDWNFGGSKWKLSRSKIDLFVECPRCFYLDNKLGVKRPPGFPFNLNSAVDYLLKKEFDFHRARKSKHPLMEEYHIDAVPFDHHQIDEWRENFVGVQFFHQQTGMTISGAVDDIWQNAKTHELHVVDYKATSKTERPTLDAEWQDGYKRQMEVYQWLLRKNGHTVSDTGYFVYANGLRDREAFDKKIEFDVQVIPYTGDDSWVEPTIYDIHACLSQGTIPQSDPRCDYCSYREHAKNAVETTDSKKEKSISKAVSSKKLQQENLFSN